MHKGLLVRYATFVNRLFEHYTQMGSIENGEYLEHSSLARDGS
ncbi:hypothetical protein [Methylomonas sp. AM2-LC]